MKQARVPAPQRELRRFAFIVGGVLAGIGLLPLVTRGAAPRTWLLAIAALLGAAGWLGPGALRPLYNLWMRIGHVLGWLNTRVLLGAIYFLLVTPIGLVRRALGQDPLDRRLADHPTYWRRRTAPADPRRTMERRF